MGRVSREDFEAIRLGYSRCGDPQGFLCFERDLIISGKHPDEKEILSADHVAATEYQVNAEIEGVKACQTI